MRASTILSLAAFSLALCSAPAWAEETKAPAAGGKVQVVAGMDIKVKRHIPASVDVSRLVPRAPLPALRKPLIDGIGNAVDKDCF